MIEVHTLHDKGGRAVRIHSLGHADYGNGAIDIVCVAVSALELNFASSVKESTDVKFEVHLDGKSSNFNFRPLGEHNGKTELLLQFLLLGYQIVQEAYGNSYLMIKGQEV